MDGNDRWAQMRHMPELNLLIHMGGEQRISNFLLWQRAYAELYFMEVLLPEFDTVELNQALNWFAKRCRRFGKTGEQLINQSGVEI